MKDKTKTRNLIIIGAIIVIIALAGYFYTNRDQSSNALLLVNEGSATASVDSDLLNALRTLKQLKLDSSIFSNAAWLSLTDFSQILPTQSSGRTNPFAPIGSSVFASTTSQ